jgi:hypothetical protein
MRQLGSLLLVGLVTPGVARAGDPFRDDLPMPSYRLLGSMLAQFHDEAAVERGEKTLELAGPLIVALDRRYGARVEADLRRAIAQKDRNAALRATTLLVLLDTQDLLEGVARDDYTGWSDAKVRVKKAFLNYHLITESLRASQGDLDRRVIAAFGELALELHDSDLSTPPERINAARDAVTQGLVRLRHELLISPSTRRDAGAGG